MSKRIVEAATLSVDPTTKALRVCLISEGVGSSAEFPRSFFVQENANRLARSLSFPAHPVDPEHPEHRDPMSAVGSVGETVTIEEHDGLVGFWADYIPSAARPEIGPYLREYGDRLGLSVFSDSDGHRDAGSGRWVCESLTDLDPYRSVDLVVAAGRGGKFEKVSESLGLLTKTPAPAVEDKEIKMDKEIADEFAKLNGAVEKITEALEGKAKADLQVQADETAVSKAVESRLAECNKVKDAVDTAKLTESQAKGFLDRAAKGETLDKLQPEIDTAKAIVAEARAGFSADDEEEGGHQIAEAHLGGGSNKTSGVDLSIPGFGEV